jgi:hypothetical protein
MKRNHFALLGVVTAGLALALFHWQSARSARQRQADLNGLRAQLASQVRQANALDRELANLRQNVPLPIHAIPVHADEQAAKNSASSASPAPAQPSRMQVIARDPALHELYVRAYVNQRDLAFAGLLKKLAFTPEQRRTFEEIQARFQEGLLDCAEIGETNGSDSPDSRRREAQRQVVAVQDAQLAELFGPSLEQWKEANRTLGSRELVAQIVQLNLQGAEAYDAPSTERLAAILANHRARSSPSPGSLGYEWDAILPQAQAALTPSQWEGFKTSVLQLRTQAKVNALANGK